MLLTKYVFSDVRNVKCFSLTDRHFQPVNLIYYFPTRKVLYIIITVDL